MVSKAHRPAALGWPLPSRFQFRSRLGADGLLESFLVFDVEDERPAVLKAVTGGGAPLREPKAFLDAMEKVRGYRHEVVVPVVWVGLADELPLYATEHVPGVTAKDKLDAHGPAPVRQVIEILGAVSRALAAAHAHGLLHLGLSARHVVLARGQVRLDGVGVVQALNAAGAPGRWGENASSDVVRLGALALELLAGRAVSLDGGRCDPGSVEAVLTQRSDIPGALATLVRRCMKAEAAAGGLSMADASEALAEIQLERPDTGDESGPPPAERIGPYVIHDVLGKGGMGVVYLAEQVEPLRRLVALKLIKPGMDTDYVLARFAAERQVLALMDHPGIAKVLDAGATPTGRPYVAMELVEGPGLIQYADRHGLSLRERVELFLPLCRAIRHAHQKGIIHRDLKPSNVLVAERDGFPAPVVIDFGLAKALGPSPGEETVLTQAGQLVGTLDYMSPEQAAAHADVDTRSDVYALGAMLYQLLAGTVPHGDAETALSSDDLRHRILTTEPQRPSARLDALGGMAGLVAESRGTDPSTLRRALRDELDWIVLKAMAREQAERYQTVDALLADLEAYLSDEPVSARAPGSAYRLRKFLRRHRTAVAASGAFVAALVAGLVVTTNLWLRAERAETHAASEAETAGQVADFMVNLFQVSDPSNARGNSVTARELLDGAVAHVHQSLAEQPAVAGRFLRTIGQVHIKLGLYDEALGVLGDAAALQRTRGPEGRVELAGTEGDLALALVWAGRFDEAAPLLRSSLATLEAELGVNDVQLIPVLNALALLDLQTGAYESGATLLERTNVIADAAPAYDPVERAKHLNNLGLAYRHLGRTDDARRTWERTLSIRLASLGPDHPDNAGVLHNLATLAHRSGDLGEAKRLALEALGIRERALGPAHPDVASVLNTLGSIYTEEGRYDEAVAVLSRSLSIREAALGPDHPALAGVHLNIGNLHQSRGDHAKADSSFRRAEAIWRGALGPDHPNLAYALLARSLLLAEQGRHAEAEPLNVEALRLLERALDPEHPRVVEALQAYADLLRASGRDALADSVTARIPGG